MGGRDEPNGLRGRGAAIWSACSTRISLGPDSAVFAGACNCSPGLRGRTGRVGTFIGAGTIVLGGTGGLGGGAVTRGNVGAADPPPPAAGGPPPAAAGACGGFTLPAGEVAGGTFGGAAFGGNGAGGAAGAAATGTEVAGGTVRVPVVGLADTDGLSPSSTVAADSFPTPTAESLSAADSTSESVEAAVELGPASCCRFFGAAFFAFSRSAPTSTCSLVSAALEADTPPNHSRIVSARPSGTVACGVVTPSTPSRAHFSMMSLVDIPMSFAIWVIRTFLRVLVATTGSVCFVQSRRSVMSSIRSRFF